MEKIYTNSTLLLDSNQESINKVTHYIDEICSTNPNRFSASYGNIIIAMTEAVNNAIQHGNKNDSRKKVTVNYKEENGKLSFTISDEGEGFDFTNVPDPTSPENIHKLNGRGIFLMKNLVDQLNFHNDGKMVELIFDIA